MLSSRILVALLVGLFISATVSASPIFDGNFTVGEYYSALNDGDGNEPVIQDDLDIKTVGFDVDDDYFYLGVEVYAGPLATDGGAETMLGQTRFYARFDTGSATDDMLQINLNASGVINVILNGTVLATGDYDVAIGSGGTNSGLELRVDKALLSPLNFTFFGQIDDTGWANDDQIFGAVDIPEPVTLTLMAIGLPLALIRRRRR